MNAENLTLDNKIAQISIDDIIPNRFQPRLVFEQKSLEELADSIRNHGIIQPLVVRRISDKYEIIAGERRYKASIIAGLKKLPCIIMNLDDKESAEVAIVENIQRKEMTPLEEAMSYKKLLDKGYLTQDQLATRMGKSQPLIANKLRLLSLDEEVKDALMNEKISERHARSLLSLKTKEEQKEILHRIMQEKLTVKQTDELIKEKIGSVSNKPSFTNLESGLVKEEIMIKPNIPNPYSENEPNPQLNMINKLNSSDLFKDPIDEQPETDIEKPIEFNAEEIKSNAVDINIPQNNNVDITSLLKKDQKEEVDKTEDINQESKNRFIFDFDDDFTDIEVLDIKEDDFQNVEVQEEISSDIKMAINMIKDNIETLKSNKFKVTFEEFDFEKIYQVVIKIEK